MMTLPTIAAGLQGRKAAFVRHLIAGLEPKAAATAAGYAVASAGHRARKLMLDPEVSAALKDAEDDRAEVLRQIEEARAVAVAVGDAGAAVRAIELRRKFMGLG